MRLIRNLLALIGFLAVVGIAVLGYRYGPFMAKMDPELPRVYKEFMDTLVETGDPGVSMMWRVQVKEGMTPEDVVESLKSLATARNFLFVGESPFYKQIKAITGEDYRYANFLSFCDARVGKAMLEYQGAYSGFMPCRIAVVEDKNGRLWLFSMNLDMMIYGGKKLPEDLKQQAIRIRTVVKEMMDGAAKGEF